MINEFIEKLKVELKNRNYSDVEGIISYFEEIIKDRIDNGEKEEDIIKELEDPKTIVNSLMGEVSLSDYKDTIKSDEVINSNTDEHYESHHINNINVDLTDFSILIEVYDGDKVLVDVEGKGSNKIDIDFNGDTLDISENSMFAIGIGWPFFKKKIENFNDLLVKGLVHVKLPYKQYDNLNIENVSGNITLNNLSFNNVDIENVSGKSIIDTCEFNELNIENVSGMIDSNDLKAINELNVENVSGRVLLNRVISDNIAIETVSGGIDVLVEGYKEDYRINITKILDEINYDNGGSKSLEIESVSGSIKYGFTN